MVSRHPEWINEKDDDDNTPLHLAAKSGEWQLVEWLADHGAEINCTSKAGQTPLYLATKNNHVDIVDQLVKRKGVDVNYGAYWKSPLEVAVENGYFYVAEKLLDSGADCKGMKKDDVLLICAVHEGSIPDVKWLVEHGADVNCKDVLGKTPLDVAGGDVCCIFKSPRCPKVTGLFGLF